MLKWSSPLRYVKGLDAEQTRILAAKGMRTVADLLYYAPRSYEDRTDPVAIGGVQAGQSATLVATVTNSFLRRMSGGPVFEAELSQGNRRLRCRWFYSDYLANVIRPGQLLVVHGRIETDRASGRPLIVHPLYQVLDDAQEAVPATSLEVGRIVPIYETAGNGRLGARFFRRLIHSLLERTQPVEDPLPPAVRAPLILPDRWQALQRLHFPEPDTDLGALNSFKTPEQFRLIFEEFFFHQVGVLLRRRKRQNARGVSFKFTDAVRAKTSALLASGGTLAQKRVLKEIASDMLAPWPMYRLLQGDVGSGKVTVALQAAAIAIENGYQVAVIAPTEELAEQHYLNFTEICQRAGYRVALLAGSVTATEKAKLGPLLREGSVHIAIGTEDLLGAQCRFRALGLVIVDEQYCCGAVERMRLIRRGPSPDVLAMTAIPVPRALALTLYGDLDLSVIDQLPRGQSPIMTRHLPQSRVDQVYELVRREVHSGRQAYIVYPVEDASEKADLPMAIESYERLAREVFRDLRVGLMHGRMPHGEKKAVISAFKSGRLQVLVSTSVIEVGVQVPNATVMVIERAERFGLAQLHQLRGRLGRGAAESYCILVSTEPATDEARERIGVLVRTQDGFEVGECDVTLSSTETPRGVRRRNLPAFRIADLGRDREVLELARRAAQDFLDQAPRRDVAKLVSYLREQSAGRYGLLHLE